MSIGGKLCNLISLYWSLSQSTDIFEKILDNFELTQSNVANNNPFIVVFRDFSAKSPNWHKHNETS